MNTTTGLELYSQHTDFNSRHSTNAQQHPELPLQPRDPTLILDLIWLRPRIWQIYQRNGAPESCPLDCGQRCCGLKWKHGGNILNLRFPELLQSCTRPVHEYRHGSEATNKMNIPWDPGLSLTAGDLQVVRSGKQWAVTLGLSGFKAINKNNIVNWKRPNYCMLHFARGYFIKNK